MPTAVVPESGREGSPEHRGEAQDAVPPLAVRLLVYWSAIGGFLLIAVSMMTPVILVGSMAAPLLVCDHRALRAELLKINPLTVVLAIAAVYLSINATWSLDRKSALVSLATIYAVVVATHVCASALAVTRAEYLRAMRTGTVIGICVGAGFLCFEYVTKLSIQRSLQWLQAAAHVKLVRINVSNETIGAFTFIMNRNLVELVILVWMAGLLQMRREKSRGGRALVVGLVAVVVLCAALSPSASAKMGLLAGAAMFALHVYAPEAGRVLLMAAWSVLCVLALPIAKLLYGLKLYDVGWLPSSARHRVIIWGASSDWYWKAPWLGAGVGSARGLDELDPAHRVDTPGLQDAGLNWHAHNAYVQVWFEAGLVGAVLLLVIGLLLLREVYRMPRQDQPFLAAAFTSAMVAASTAFSIWAAWFLAAFGMAAIFATLARPPAPANAQSSTK